MQAGAGSGICEATWPWGGSGGRPDCAEIEVQELFTASCSHPGAPEAAQPPPGEHGPGEPHEEMCKKARGDTSKQEELLDIGPQATAQAGRL